MPYVPKEDRPFLDKKVDALAEELALRLIKKNQTAEISEMYRNTFDEISDTITNLELLGKQRKPKTKAEKLAYGIIEVAEKYEYQGAWLGELNYSITTLIQAVPLKMVKKGEWKEALRYWLYAETIGALTRTASDIHQKTGNHWISNGLVGVFEDVRDEYKRRVNTAYEAAQILKSGDCYDMSPYRTELVPLKAGNVDGFIEIMLPKQEPKK